MIIDNNEKEWSKLQLPNLIFYYQSVKVNRLLLLQVFLDRFVEREIQSLLVHCIHQEEGCDWRDELRKREVTTGRCAV